MFPESHLCAVNLELGGGWHVESPFVVLRRKTHTNCEGRELRGATLGCGGLRPVPRLSVSFIQFNALKRWVRCAVPLVGADENVNVCTEHVVWLSAKCCK